LELEERIMRALLGLLCLFCGSPERAGDDVEVSPSERVSEYRAVITAIAPDAAARRKEPRDLPEDLQKALETWLDG